MSSSKAMCLLWKNFVKIGTLMKYPKTSEICEMSSYSSDVSYPVPLYRKLHEETAYSALEYSCKKLEYSIDRPGMNPRSIAEGIDDKVMGDIACIELKEFLKEKGVFVKTYDELRIDDYKQPDPGWDLVAGSAAKKWLLRVGDPSIPDNDVIKLSVKSSRIPRGRTIEYCISNFDFKIFRVHDTIVDDIISEIEVQVYYQYEESRFIGFQVTSDQVKRAKRDGYHELMEKLDILERYRTPILTAFIKREEMIEISKDLAGKNRAIWVSVHEGYNKEMWRMPLKLGRDIRKLPFFL